MNYFTLALWAIPYAARWSLSQVGITYTVPASGIAANKTEEAYQQAIAVGAGAAALSVLSPAAAGVWLAVLVPVKVYNWLRIPSQK